MSNKRTANILRTARGFIEKGWCKHKLAVDAKGNEVKPKSKEAVAWCAIGALEAATKRFMNIDEPWNALALAIPAGGPSTVINFNNEARSKRQVLRLFDRAIEMLG